MDLAVTFADIEPLPKTFLKARIGSGAIVPPPGRA